ncbi:MAG: cytochrome C oxidase subunit IV family protein [Phycisphaerae bacterium]|nr:cytochrome C oxidase subunit IV family protein [Phycisphaerae bacterium]
MSNHSIAPDTSHGHHSAVPGDKPLVGHLVPIGLLVANGTALLLLTVVTMALHYVDLGELNIVVALAVATLKATLVGLFFMHLRWDRPFNQLIFVGSVVFVALLIAFVTLDTRQYQSTIRPGNPKMVQDVLDADAPTAPITAKKGY